METLNMFSGGYIYKLTYEDNKIVFNNHFRLVRKRGMSSQVLVNPSPYTLVIKHEIWNMIERFKSVMFHAFSLHRDGMNIKKGQEEAERALAIYFLI